MSRAPAKLALQLRLYMKVFLGQKPDVFEWHDTESSAPVCAVRQMNARMLNTGAISGHVVDHLQHLVFITIYFYFTVFCVLFLSFGCFLVYKLPGLYKCCIPKQVRISYMLQLYPYPLKTWTTS